MQRLSINKGWRLSRAAPMAYFSLQGKLGAETMVDLPHDCNIGEAVSPDCPDGAGTAYFKGGMALYTQYLHIPEEWAQDCVYLELDGAYCNTEIFLNGHKIAFHPNGYTPFLCELTEHLKFGAENRLAVFVNNSMGRTARWYSGTGIYRSVDLRVAPRLQLTPNPLFITTVYADDSYAELLVQVEAENKLTRPARLKARVTLHEDNGHGQPAGETAIAAGECFIHTEPSQRAVGRCRIHVEQPKLWNVDSPALYIVRVELFEQAPKEGTLHSLDSDHVLFGIRTLSVDAVKGLQLNGKPLKLKGGCVHHDNGLLGAASFYDSEYRRLMRHKDNGFNAIRCAHNPMSRDMMECCDRLGLLVYAEAFDVWTMHKNVNDYHLFFEDWWERDLRAFIERDRNHPSIFCWSIANEVGERNGLQGGMALSAKLTALVRTLDPTRPVSAGVPTLFNGMDDEDTTVLLQEMMHAGGPGQNVDSGFADSVWAERTEGFCAPLDIVGYNYLDSRYEKDHARFPARIMCGTESYPRDIDRVWALVERLPYVIGDFTWTSQDYLGEVSVGNIVYQEASLPPLSPGALQMASRFPARTAHCSDFDICGHDTPSLHYRKIVWGSDETYLAVMHPKNYGMAVYRTGWALDECDNHWNFAAYEGKPIQICVYSAAEEVELVINGLSAGRMPAGKGNRYKACYDTVYHAGGIEAISYSGGAEISRQVLVTTGQAAGLAIQTEQDTLAADGQSLAFCNIEVVDRHGRHVPDAEVPMRAWTEGAGSLAAFGSGIASTEELYTTGSFSSFQGRLQAIVRSGYEPGEVTLFVEAGEGWKASVTIKVI